MCTRVGCDGEDVFVLTWIMRATGMISPAAVSSSSSSVEKVDMAFLAL